MIHIIAYHNGAFKPLADFVKPLWQEYADRHGYQFVCTWCEDHLNGAHYSFTKTFFVSQYLKHGGKDAESVFVIDLDMIPTNMTIALEEFSRFRWEILMTKDINGWNSGAYFVRPGEIAQCWLQTIIALRNHGAESEQRAMWWINAAFGVGEALQPSFNSIPYDLYDYGPRKEDDGQWGDGHFVLHLPGMTMEKRIEILKSYIPLIER